MMSLIGKITFLHTLGYSHSSLRKSDLKIGQQLNFCPDDANSHDANTIAVKTTGGAHIGHIARELAPTCRKFIALGNEIDILLVVNLKGFKNGQYGSELLSEMSFFAHTNKSYATKCEMIQKLARDCNMTMCFPSSRVHAGTPNVADSEPLQHELPATKQQHGISKQSGELPAQSLNAADIKHLQRELATTKQQLAMATRSQTADNQQLAILRQEQYTTNQQLNITRRKHNAAKKNLSITKKTQKIADKNLASAMQQLTNANFKLARAKRRSKQKALSKAISNIEKENTKRLNCYSGDDESSEFDPIRFRVDKNENTRKRKRKQSVWTLNGVPRFVVVLKK